MNDLERVLKAANDLGHLLGQNEIVRRYREIGERLGKAEESKRLLDDYLKAVRDLETREMAGQEVGPEEESRIRDLDEKVRQDALLREFIATQNYYMHLMAEVNAAIQKPSGEPPRESNIVVPGESASRIIIP